MKNVGSIHKFSSSIPETVTSAQRAPVQCGHRCRPPAGDGTTQVRTGYLGKTLVSIHLRGLVHLPQPYQTFCKPSLALELSLNTPLAPVNHGIISWHLFPSRGATVSSLCSAHLPWLQHSKGLLILSPRLLLLLLLSLRSQAPYGFLQEAA